MLYSEAIKYLYDLRMFGAKLGLENTRRLAALAGSPQEKLRFIHVAGTNGKGSVCAMLESIYRAAGLKVGLFTSPHLVSFGERMQVNRQSINEADVVRLVGRMRELVKSLDSAEHPTFFELVTVMALTYFAEQKCDLVVWETGMGGRLDATNIVRPLASVITNVQFDHQKWLGDTLTKIAAEKAGIIKPGVPVLTAADAPEALEVIRDTAQAQQAPLTVVTRDDIGQPPLNAIDLPLLGDHQRLHAALAIAVVRAVNSHIPVGDAAIRRGLEQVHWAGRLQLLRQAGRKILLDGAHNLSGVETLAAALRKHFPGETPTLIVGIMQDKDWKAMCAVLAPLTRRLLLAPVSSERTSDPAQMAPVCRAANPDAEVMACGSLKEALDRAADDPFMVVTGSLHFIGEAIEQLGAVTGPAQNERGLNEWNAVPPTTR